MRTIRGFYPIMRIGQQSTFITKFPGNPTKSYRTQAPLKIIGEVVGWNGHTQEVLQSILEKIQCVPKEKSGRDFLV